MFGDAKSRKAAPVCTGVLDFFPRALAEVARVSLAGHAQHGVDGPLRFVRGLSNDHADALVRHLLERGTLDSDGQRHSAKVAWRALALLQEELEASGRGSQGENDSVARTGQLAAKRSRT